ncbi:MAG TPA: PP2C family serine/threonine-protein phosphatase [Anaeromyxobacteraceae bacterium]|nr:PP2C family serine/threonine-protein phosphatase [Anaeromyxobacteraceae bacterium]
MGWKVFASSVIGTGHVREGTKCQDKHRFRIGPGPNLVVAVADGAGSSQFADIGAEMVALHSSFLLQRDLANGEAPGCAVLQRAFTASRENLLALNDGLRLRPGYERMELGHLACTLILLAVSKDTLAIAQVGDGTVVAQRPGGHLERFSNPRTSEYVNETVFVTSENYLEAFTFRSLPCEGLGAFAIMTDGLESLAINYRTREPERAFFDPLFEFARTASADDAFLQHLLDREEINERTNDDKTLVIATRT